MTRSDPYQQRCRELAIADGLDPDARVGEGRGVPVWCTFRDAARAEHNALEAATLAAALPTIAPQSAEFQNSPLTIFGQHDANTIAQMKNCMAVGNVVAGVICADGHLGYAQPVGGVVAYEKQISISGVGFDIGCVDSETEFLSPSGWIKISDWEIEKPLVCEYNLDTGRGNFVEPLRFIKQQSAGFWHLKTKYGVNQVLSSDHKMLLYTHQNWEFTRAFTMRAEDFCKKHNRSKLGTEYRIDTAFRIERGSRVNLSVADIRVFIMQCADGSIDKSGAIIVSVKKIRKIERARLLLLESGIPFTERPQPSGFVNFRFTPILGTKSLATLWPASQEQLDVIVDELLKWDGSDIEYKSGHMRVFFTREQSNADFVSYAFAATGHRSVLRYDKHKRDGGIDYRVFMYDGRKTKVGLKASPPKKIEFIPSIDGMEYCFTVPSGFIVIRRNGIVSLTGNCGNMAVRLDTPFTAIKDNIGPIIHEVQRIISFGVGRKNDERVEHELFDDAEAWKSSGMEDYKSKAVSALGTCGSGNHYIDLMRDEDGFVWIGVHFGSRGLGHTSATRYLKAAGGKDGMNVPPAVIDEDSEIGRRYIAAMELSGRYAYAGREWVVERVRKIVGGAVTDTVHNFHNFAWRETHNGKDLWVVRKGATPAWPGQRGFVGGSMGDDAVIIEGIDSAEAKASLYSTVHGAGRLFGRKEAKRRFKRAEMDRWLQERGVTLIGADLDESPMAYRRLPEVLAAHSNSIKVLHTLRPFAVAMAGSGETDPFKD